MDNSSGAFAAHLRSALWPRPPSSSSAISPVPAEAHCKVEAMPWPTVGRVAPGSGSGCAREPRHKATG